MSGLGLIFNRFLPTASDITVAGITVGTATALNEKGIYLTGTSGGGHFARVVSAVTAMVYFIYNKSGTNITLLPAVGDFINGADSSTGITIVNLDGVFMWAMDDTDWKAVTLEGF